MVDVTGAACFFEGTGGDGLAEDLGEAAGRGRDRGRRGRELNFGWCFGFPCHGEA